MKYLLLFLLLPFLAVAQLTPSRTKGEVFKHRPDTPYEALNKSGLVFVKKGMYGLFFEDNNLSPEVRKKVQIFFDRRYNGYTDLKTYQLRIENTAKGWKIEGYLIQ
ncbi:MAG: hypothetical protein ACTTJM_03165 [Bergeyella cardium]|nr:MAG TPA: hypothetical protein [Caudoviricetes sp.]